MLRCQLLSGVQVLQGAAPLHQHACGPSAKISKIPASLHTNDHNTPPLQSLSYRGAVCYLQLASEIVASLAKTTITRSLQKILNTQERFGS